MYFSGFKYNKKKKIYLPNSNLIRKWKFVKRNHLNYLRLAALLAAKRKCTNQGFYVGAVGIRSDGVLVHAFNGSGNNPVAQGHAETRLSRKLDVGSIVYVARYSFLTNDLVLAKPCQNCERTLFSFGVKRIYYSISESKYGTLNF